MFTAFRSVISEPDPEPEEPNLPEEVQTIELFSQEDANKVEVAVAPNMGIQKTINLADYIDPEIKEITVNFNSDNTILLENNGGVSMESGEPCGIFINNTSEDKVQVLDIEKKYPAENEEKLTKAVKLDLSQTKTIDFTLVTPWARYTSGDTDYRCYNHLFLTYSKSINEQEPVQTIVLVEEIEGLEPNEDGTVNLFNYTAKYGL